MSPAAMPEPERREPAPAPLTRRPRRIAHPVRWVAGVCLVALVVVAVVAATRPSSQATQVQSPLLGDRAPALSGTELGGHGARYSLAAERGHWVYVNFFASWCPPCQTEEQTLVSFQFQQSKKSGGARLLSVVFNDTPTDAAKFDQQWGVRWPVVADKGGAIANAFGVTAPPTTFLVNPAGKIVGTYEGPVTTAQLDSMLKAGKAGELASGGTGGGGG